MEDRDGVIIRGLDLLDILGLISDKNKKYQAIILSDIELVLGKDSKEFKQIRKIVLDGVNDYTRSAVRILFGDINY